MAEPLDLSERNSCRLNAGPCTVRHFFSGGGGVYGFTVLLHSLWSSFILFTAIGVAFSFRLSTDVYDFSCIDTYSG
jgi:hypothetical protein